LAVKVDGEEIFAEQCGFAFVGNLRQYGTGFPILVDARPDDGLLDICAVRCDSVKNSSTCFSPRPLASILSRKDLFYRKGEHVEITSSAPVRVGNRW